MGGGGDGVAVEGEGGAVEGGVAHVGNPVAEDDYAGAFDELGGKEVVMAHDVEVGAFSGGKEGVAPADPGVGGGGVVGAGAMMLASVFAAPPVGEANGPAGMDGGIEPLQEAGAEGAAHEFFGERDGSEAIAMGYDESLAADFFLKDAVDHTDAKLGGKIVENPNVVIANEPGDFDAGIGKVGNGAEKTDKTAGNDMAILKPIVKNIAHEVDAPGSGGYGAQPGTDAPLELARVSEIARAQVEVGEEVGESGVHQRKPSSSLASSLIMS